MTEQLNLFASLPAPEPAEASAPPPTPPPRPRPTAVPAGISLRPPAPPLGEVHDLHALFAEINARYFGGAIAATIAWSRRAPPGRRRRFRRTRRITFKLGGWSETGNRITIHPILDHPSVPRYVVAAIVHHEMLHAHLGVERRGGRRYVHTPEFRHLERRFAQHAEAEGWICDNLRDLARRRAAWR